ncbi:TNF receptor-associated factor 1 isoform X2 [Pangasianodon hypophthalmus]|uniref:TNF receptor-associated factor 1 isoform X2 n=1 Tax=Pangasianodon hypophthalmus TaxID=310915 RepID=UPI00230776DD|nr:TNF receptor-associated factor 1 isoform X2 [Pangasianodon hypophthalmus]
MALAPLVSSSPGENEYPSGFPQSICDEVPAPKYLCSHCDCVLNGAHQSACGHRYCLACVHWLIRNNKNLVCTKCKEDPNQQSNHGLLTLDQEHQSQCEYALIPCNVGCGLMVLRRTLATHLEKGCPNNKSTCPTCSSPLTPSELQKHVCPSDKKATKAEKRQKDNKQANSKRKETCHFSEVGCTFKGSVEKVREHESSSSAVHLQLILEVLRGIRISVPSPPDRSVHFPGLDLLLHGQSSPSVCVQSTGELETDGDGGVNDMALSLHDDQAELEVGQQLHALQQRLQIMENIITALNREVEKTQLTVAALDRDSHNSMQLVEHLESVVADQQQRMIRKDVHIASLQQSISAQQDVSYDGTFLWKICDVSQKLREAATGQRSSQYSPAFYTSRYGFKVCMRLYMHGDGAGKGTHISLFFVIMRGEYDPLLSWPFKHKVTFFLIDQNQREHVIDTFRPDLSSASFQRPVSEMNVASGCPLFCPLARLRSPKHAYCKDDTLFIKCVVDSSS